MAALPLFAVPASAQDRSPARRAPEAVEAAARPSGDTAGFDTSALSRLAASLGLSETWLTPPSPEAVRRVVEEAMAAVARAEAEAERRIAEAEAEKRRLAERLSALSAEKAELENRLTDALSRAAALEAGVAPDAAALRAEVARLETALAEAKARIEALEEELARLRAARQAPPAPAEVRTPAPPPAETAAPAPAPPAPAARPDTAPRLPDPNYAPYEVLAAIPFVGPERAAAIVWYRERVGRFRRVEDLIRVPGFDRARVEAVRKYLEIWDGPAEKEE